MAALAQDEVVAALSVALEQLSDGNLAKRINMQFPASYEKLRQDFNTTVARLRETVGSHQEQCRVDVARLRRDCAGCE